MKSAFGCYHCVNCVTFNFDCQHINMFARCCGVITIFTDSHNIYLRGCAVCILVTSNRCPA